MDEIHIIVDEAAQAGTGHTDMAVQLAHRWSEVREK